MYMAMEENGVQRRRNVADYHRLSERQDLSGLSSPSEPSEPSGASSSIGYIVTIIVVVIIIVAGVGGYSWLRAQRARNLKPWFLPKRLEDRWWAWREVKPRNPTTTNRRQNLASTETSYHAPGAQEAGVNRNTSVRSVISLPAYSHAAKDNEQVLGREGERAGMDTVVEFPETAEDEETRRDQEMEELYQVRVARRREAEEREDRRRERQEARERGDYRRLEELRQESRLRAEAANRSTTSLNDPTVPSSTQLLAEFNARGRDRRVSSVTYADIGHVRHDGSRVRAGSIDSERNGLLTDAASMGRLRGHSNASSIFTNGEETAETRRARAGSPHSSVSTTNSHDEPTPESSPNNASRPRQRSDANDQTSNSSPTATFTPRESPTSDIDEPRAPITVNRTSAPPDYENLDWGDAPAYEEAVRRATSSATARSVQRPNTRELTVPVINVQAASEPNTPATVQSATFAQTRS